MSGLKSICSVLLIGGLVPLVYAGVGHDEARKLRLSGQILPLTEILNHVKQYPGDVLSVELEREDEGYIYEIQLLAPDGHIWELELDAHDGHMLERELEEIQTERPPFKPESPAPKTPSNVDSSPNGQSTPVEKTPEPQKSQSSTTQPEPKDLEEK